MRSTYTLDCYIKEENPVWAVTIRCPILNCVKFFLRMDEALNYIMTEYANLADYGYNLSYDPYGTNDDNSIAVINYVLENNDIAIGNNGRTYSKTLYPAGI